jgi:hypothetical protein
MEAKKKYEIISKLKKLANHPNTPKEEVEKAKKMIQDLLTSHFN